MKKIDRILKYIENQKITTTTFERKTQLSNGYFKNTVKRGQDITQKILDRIKENAPDDYYKIFPEEKEGAAQHVDLDHIYPQGDVVVEKLKEENEQLRAKLMESQEKIIKLQEKLLGLSHNDDDHLGGISQTKRSG